MAVANRDKTHCPRGHRLAAPNLVKWRFKKKGIRECRICHNAKCREYYRLGPGQAQELDLREG